MLIQCGSDLSQSRGSLRLHTATASAIIMTWRLYSRAQQ
ncbi:hypothetical protein X975_08632, partial [Stegodyphus mimosarum]